VGGNKAFRKRNQVRAAATGLRDQGARFVDACRSIEMSGGGLRRGDPDLA
jgi:hypothetical protein